MAVTWLAAIVNRRVVGRRHVATVRLTTSGAGNTYTTTGDTAPAFGALGMKRNVEQIIFTDTSPSPYLYEYDTTNNKIKVFGDSSPAAAGGPLTEAAAATALNSLSFLVEVTGW